VELGGDRLVNAGTLAVARRFSEALLQDVTPMLFLLMKTITSCVLVLIAIIAETLLCSCQQSPGTSSPPSFAPTQNGFGVVVKPLEVDSGPGAGLYYKGTNEVPVLVWPYIGTAGYPILYTNDVALLLADKPDYAGRLGHGALIAVQNTGPALDISADVLKLAAEEAHVDFKKALRVSEPLRLIQTNSEQIEVHFVANQLAEPSIPNLKVRCQWKQVFAIMDDVRKFGRTNRVTNLDGV